MSIAAEMLEHEPDMVLIYSGHNEFGEVEQRQFASPGTVKLQKAIAHSALVRFIRDRITDVYVLKLTREHEKRVADPWVDAQRAWAYQFTAVDVKRRMLAFRNNLSFIIAGCKEKDVPVIIGTVPSNLYRPYLPEKERKQYFEVVALIMKERYEEAYERGKEILAATVGRHQSSDLENGIIRSLAEQYAIPLADVEAAVIKAEPHGIPGETLFKDHCHLNDKGNAILIKTYESRVIEVLQ